MRRLRATNPERIGGGAAEVAPAGSDSVDGVHEFSKGLVFADIAAGTGVEHRLDEGDFIVRRQREHAYPGVEREQGPGDCGPARIRHFHVEQHDIGQLGTGAGLHRRQGLPAAFGQRPDRQARLPIEDLAEAAPEGGMVVDDEDADGHDTQACAPSPSAAIGDELKNVPEFAELPAAVRLRLPPA
jgi:hypothetical protein